jgi:hypothetical protein
MMSAFTPGMRLSDRYQLQERIGAGGMADVWRAQDLVLGREVAVKTLLDGVEHWQGAARQEARAAARLTHPNITAVHDFGEAPEAGPYLVMELLTGQTLAHRLDSGPIAWPQARQILAQITSALIAAHAQGVVHQDIKPSNIMLTPAGVKVLDFGIAAIRGRENPGWTSGTPAYAPPERLRSAEPDPSADVYSLAVVAFEMVNGEPPWPAASWDEAAALHTTRAEAPTLQGIPEPAAAMLRAAVSADPSHRPPATDLALALSSPGTSTTRLMPAVPTPPTGEGTTKRIIGTARVPQRPVSGTAGATGTGAGATRKVPAGSAGSVAGVGRGARPVTRAMPAYPASAATTKWKAPRRRKRRPFVGATLLIMVLLCVMGTVFFALAGFRPTDEVNAEQSTAAPVQETKPAQPTTQPVVEPQDEGNIPELLAGLRTAVETAARTGTIAGDEADELRNKVQDLTDQWQKDQRRGFVDRVEDLREDIDKRADDGQINKITAIALDLLLKELAERAAP